MEPGGLVISLVLVVVGALVGFLPTFLNERRKELHSLRIRWDAPLYDLSKDFVATVRQHTHLVRRLDRGTDRPSAIARADEVHARLRSLAQQVRILGGAELQEAARLVEHHAWWVRHLHEVGTDDLLESYGNVDAETRLRHAVREFVVAVRRELGVRDPDTVSDDDPIDPRSRAAPRVAEA